MRKTFSSGLAIEDRFGYSRATLVNDTLYVSATAPVDRDLNVVGTDVSAQMRIVMGRIEPILDQAGFTVGDVALVRIYLVDPSELDAVGSVFAELFQGALPAMTIVNVPPFGHPDIKVEFELVAVRQREDS